MLFKNKNVVDQTQIAVNTARSKLHQFQFKNDGTFSKKVAKQEHKRLAHNRSINLKQKSRARKQIKSKVGQVNRCHALHHIKQEVFCFLTVWPIFGLHLAPVHKNFIRGLTFQ